MPTGTKRPDPVVPVVEAIEGDAAGTPALADFALDAGSTGAVVIRGVAVGPVPATPSERTAAVAGLAPTASAALLAAAGRLGEPVGYVQEHDGLVVQDLFPLPSSVRRQISTSSDVALAFHTETAFHPHKPRYLLLLCLRGDAAAHTTLCSVDAILAELDADTVDVLRQPRFRTGVDESFGGGSGWRTPPMAVLRGGLDGPDRLELTFDDELMIGLDAEADAALDEVRQAIQGSHTSVVLDAGDLLVIDNHRAVHGRGAFQARFDGTDRWLRRSFVVPDLDASAAERRGRVITTSFEPAR